MKYGVTITGGAAPWQIFQQGSDGTASIHLEGEYHLIHLSQELPLKFTEVPYARAAIKARVALESTGENIIPWTQCTVLDHCHWEMTFPHVPAGGLYRIETYMEYEGWDGLSCTRGDMIHNIGVGDIFVIAGQSNAAGRSKNPVADEPELGVHVLRSSARWELATHPLGETTGAVHIGHYENHNPGHSPWLHFARAAAAFSRWQQDPGACAGESAGWNHADIQPNLPQRFQLGGGKDSRAGILHCAKQGRGVDMDCPPPNFHFQQRLEN